jgi:hypothetical protein
VLEAASLLVYFIGLELHIHSSFVHVYVCIWEDTVCVLSVLVVGAPSRQLRSVHDVLFLD